jgi:hypothetical protein
MIRMFMLFSTCFTYKWHNVFMNSHMDL